MSEVVRESLKTAVKGTTLIFVGSVASILLWFATKVLIVRTTTKEEFGIYALAIAVAGILGAIANAGLQNGITRYVSIFLGEGRKDDAKAVSKSALKIGLATGLAASLGLYIFADLISRHVFYMPELTAPLRAISLFCLFQVLANVLVGILRGYGLIKPRIYYINIGQPLFFLFFLGASLAFGLPYISAIYAYMFAMAVVYLSVGIYAYSKVGVNPLAVFGAKFERELFRFSLPLVGVAIMGMIFSWTDTFMLGRYTGAGEVGIYNVSMSIARLLTFAVNALAFVFMPIAGELYSKSQMVELKRTYQVLTKWVFAATVPIFFILFFFPEMTITFLFGQRYVDSSGALCVLSWGFMSSVFVGANSILLIVLGMPRQLFHTSIFGAVLNVVLNYIFIKRLGYGVMGASIATTISIFANNSAVAVLLYGRSGIHPLTSRYLRPVVGSAVVGLVIYAVAKNFPLYFWVLPLYFGLFIAGYLFSLLVTGSLDREDLDLFEAVSKKTGFRMGLLRSILTRFAQN